MDDCFRCMVKERKKSMRDETFKDLEEKALNIRKEILKLTFEAGSRASRRFSFNSRDTYSIVF